MPQPTDLENLQQVYEQFAKLNQENITYLYHLPMLAKMMKKPIPQAYNYQQIYPKTVVPLVDDPEPAPTLIVADDIDWNDPILQEALKPGGILFIPEPKPPIDFLAITRDIARGS